MSVASHTSPQGLTRRLVLPAAPCHSSPVGNRTRHAEELAASSRFRPPQYSPTSPAPLCVTPKRFPAAWRVASFLGLGLLMLGVAVGYAKVSAMLAGGSGEGGDNGERDRKGP